MRCLRPIILVALLLGVWTAPLVAQRRVSVRGYTRKDGTYVRPHTRSLPGSGAAGSATSGDGVPCGNSYISPDKICHNGNGSSSASASAIEEEYVPGMRARWVGSIADKVYFRRDCSAARDLAPTNVRLLPTRQIAESLGYRPSQVADCAPSQPIPTSLAEGPSRIVEPDLPWLASRSESKFRFYFRNVSNCISASILIQADRKYFATEEAARASGFKRSTEPNC